MGTNRVDIKTKTILHLCADIGSDSAIYLENGYNVIRVGKDMGVENYHPPLDVYGIIANPPCTQFSFARTKAKSARNLREGMNLVYHCLRVIWEAQYDLPSGTSKTTSLKFWYIENPYGLLRRFLGEPYFIYSPHEYGDTYKKKTCLWGIFNKPKKLTEMRGVLPKFDSLPSKNIHSEYFGILSRQERRSICSSKFANAFYKANK